MNYIKQLNEFYPTLDYKPLNAEAIAVYFCLLQIANKTGWIEQFRVANIVLMSKCNIDKQKLIRAREKLISQGYITYVKGRNQSEASLYSIVKLYSDTPNDTTQSIENDTFEVYASNKIDTPNNTPDNTASNTPPNMAGNTANDTINKQNKTKQKNKKEIIKEKKFIPPTFEEIEKYVSEKKLKVNAKGFFDYFTVGNWIDSKGNPVKNWKQKLLTWNTYSKQQSNQSEQVNKLNEKVNYVEDTRTVEEYFKELKGG